MAGYNPSGSNTWVPSFEASGQVISFIRDPNKFRINNYCAYRPATKPIGLYLKIDSDHAARVVNADDYAWPDGAERPMGPGNTLPFEFLGYKTERRDIPVVLGNIAINNADWPILAHHSSMAMQQEITLRTKLLLDQCQDTANWGTHYATAASLNGISGGRWDVATGTEGSTYYMAIKSSLQAAILQIMLDTNSMVDAASLRLVISPGLAAKISKTGEILEFLKQSPFAMAQVTGNAPGRNRLFGLPDQLYGVELEVEDATIVTTRKGAATQTKAFIKNDTTALLVSKVDALPGDQVGESPAPNFSTVQIFHYGPEATVEQWDDVRNLRKETHVVSNIHAKLIEPLSGFLITTVSA